MAQQPGSRQSSWNAGELHPSLAGRVDIKQYYSGGLSFRNIEAVPQSGFKQMAGTWDVGRVRGTLTQVTKSNVSETAGPHTGTQTVYQCDVSSNVTAVRLSAIAATTGSHTLTVEVNSAAGWTQLGTAVATVNTTAKHMTFALAPGVKVTSATGVRVRVVFSTSASVTLGTVTVLTESASGQDIPRYASLRHDSGERYNLSVSTNWMDIFLDDAFVAGVFLPEITSSILPEIGFYTENATIGIFHRTLHESLRIRRSGNSDRWERDLWPYDGVPTADFGSTYSKTDDVWEIFIRYTGTATDYLYLTLIVEGETTSAVVLTDSGGSPVNVNDGGTDWTLFAANVEDALQALPSLGAGVTVAHDDLEGPGSKLTVTFGGALSGAEYQVTPQITNTADVSALPVHLTFGKTAFEPIISSARGGPGVVGLVQDRLAYGDFNSVRAAIALSRAAEYFNINVEALGASAARIDRLRAGETAERVLAFIEATYFLVFTDQRVHFAANRTISRDEPLNYTITSSTGIVANTEPVDLEGKIFYAGQPDEEAGQSGHRLLSLAYTELETRFDPVPESLLASHLVEQIKRTAPQRSAGDSDAAKIWLMRSDGVLTAAHVIRSQEILGFSRWYAAASGLVKEICVDARNRPRICVSRGGELRHERMDPDLFLHAALTLTADMAGQVTGLDIHEGREVWAIAEGYVLGPFTVASGAIELGDAYSGDIVVGLWQAPYFRSMPRYRILPNDEILKRPGRIHSADIEVIDTTSIAVGANNGSPRNITLARTGDPGDAPTPAANRSVKASGMLGSVTGTTLVVTQLRPGTLQVRDIVIQEVL